VQVGRGARRSEEKDDKEATLRQLRKVRGRTDQTLESNPSAKALGCDRQILEGRLTTKVVGRSVLEQVDLKCNRRDDFGAEPKGSVHDVPRCTTVYESGKLRSWRSMWMTTPFR
jgi:hypothetical protein